MLLTPGALASEFDDMKKLSGQGIVAAQYNLGVMYDNGGYGVPENNKTAVMWYRKAAEQRGCICSLQSGKYIR